MCEIYAGQNPANYEKVTRSIRLDGLSTSICLERRFWETLDELAAEQDMTAPRLISLLHDEVIERRGEVSNFTSMLRVCCLIFIENQNKPDMQEIMDNVA